MKNFRIVFLLIILTSLSSEAQVSTINGLKITQEAKWSGTVRIHGDVVIEKGARLTINPGTRILVGNADLLNAGNDPRHVEIIVKGVLIARGDIQNKIYFTSAAQQPQMGDWSGITIFNPEQKSIIDYCLIEYATDGLNIKKSQTQVSNSQIRYNFNSGFLTELQATPKIIRCIITENGYAGIICKYGAAPILTENLISLNQIGIVTLDRAKPNLGSAAAGADQNTGQNRIFDNMQYNLFNHSSELILAENNSWGSSDPAAIDELNQDNKDDPRYGLIDFSPILGARETSEALVVLSQNTSSQQPREVSAGAPVAVTPAQPQQNSQQINQQNIETGNTTLENNLPLRTEKEIESRIGQVQPLLTEAKTKENGQKEEKASEPVIDMEQIFLEPFLDSTKEILHKEMPQLSEAALKFKESGRIIISVVVSKGGLVENVKLLKGLSPIYNEAALKAARNFRYRPGKVKGQAVRFSTTIVFQF